MMPVLDIADLYLQISHYFWPAVRILAMFMASPIFTEKQIGKKVKVGLAFLICVLIVPGLPETSIPLFSAAGLWIGIKQLIIGMAIGLSVQLAFVAVRVAGEIIGLQMGLSFATFFDPSGGQNMPVIARLLNLLATLLFLTFNGHLWLINVLNESFVTLPVEGTPFNSNGFLALVQGAGLIFKSGLMLGLPIITLLLCMNITLGVLNRLTPQLSIFVIGFPLTLAVGMLSLAMLMYTLSPFFEHLMADVFELLSRSLLMLH